MATNTKLYIGGTVAVGFALLVGSFLWFRELPDLARFLACLSLACIASTMKVRLPGLNSTISVNFVFILMGIAQLSLPETISMAFAATVVQCLWRAKTRPRLIQVLFNASTVVISAAVAFAAAREIPGGPHVLAAMAPAATIFFVLNTGMVSMVLALVSKARLLAVWKQCHLWTFPYYLAGALIAGLITASDHTLGWRLSLMALPMMYLLYLYYFTYVSAQRPRPETA